ncbi:hypothetical protein [Pseudoalteromonas ostreae]|uniref:hypothetical protein n=1 Tax=Pseudoalteromonas ostreae TaxID=2774154 RepID=UPI001B397923|nr:hypothetical protein [Pseudoalteromonas ostreae]
MDKTIPLSSEFESSSTVITLDNPSWRIPDSIYNINLGPYVTENSKTSWRSLDSTLVGRKKDTSFINYILFDDALSFITEEFEVESTQVYSFNLVQDATLISTSKCEVFSQSTAEETVSGDILYPKKSSSSSHNTRQKTFLVCAITHNNKLWEFTLTSYNEKKVKAQLRTNNLSYEIKGVSKTISLVKNGNTVERRNSPPWLALNSGLEFFKNKKQVAALSFVGKPKIWLKQNLSTESNELLLTVSYSLTMFNWLDSEWR